MDILRQAGYFHTWDRPLRVSNLGQSLPPAFQIAQTFFTQEFMGRFGIVSVGDGYVDGALVLMVGTWWDPEQAAANLPNQYNGWPVVVQYLEDYGSKC